MKKILFILLIFTQTVFAEDTIVVVNPGNGNDIRANIVSAIASAVDGNKIRIPTGSFPVTTPTISTTKKISFIGTDSASTILYRPESASDGSLLNVPIITIDGSTWSLAPSGVKVQGIRFKSKIPSVNQGEDGLSVALDQAILLKNVPGFEIKLCSFWFFGNGGVMVRHRDYYAKGLIHNCNFYFNAKGNNGMDLGYGIVIYGENLQWIPHVNQSDGNKIFIEDNTFSWNRHAIAAGGCALYVSRYNKFYKNVIGSNISNQAIDGHGWSGGSLGGENFFSTRLMVSYMDTIVNDIFFGKTPLVNNGTVSVDSVIERAINCRGAEAIIHNVYISGYRFAVTVSYSGDDGLPYPYPYGHGYESGLTYPSTHTGMTSSLGAGDTFMWNISYNIFDGSDVNGTAFHNYGSAYFTIDRDYHQSTNSTKAKPNYTDYTYPYPVY